MKTKNQLGGELTQPTLSFAQLQMNADIMVLNGTMPSLAEVLAAIESTREKFKPKILEARRREKQARQKAGK